jgi:dienelactone hydrolase
MVSLVSHSSAPTLAGMVRTVLLRAWLCAVVLPAAFGAEPAPYTLPGSTILDLHADLSREMVAGIDRFALRELERSVAGRAGSWNRDYSSAQAYEHSVRINRDNLRRMIGAIDERVPMTGMELVGTTNAPSLIAETQTYTIWVVRWPVLDGVYGEGLLLQPREAPRARVVALPDADQTPEMLAGIAASFPPVSAHARQLAENGVQVVIPVLIDRRDEWSGNARLKRMTNQPHREWIYRQAYEMGRHIIGYEVQKVHAVIDWFAQENKRGPVVPIGVSGYAEGGLIAFYAAALDSRINATLVSGYFDSRQKIWLEPIYRNVFGLLQEFGDAEIASLITPRALVIEHRATPSIDGPPVTRRGRISSAAPGAITSPTLATVEAEFRRAKTFYGQAYSFALQLETKPDEALAQFWICLGGEKAKLAPPGKPATPARREFNLDARQQRQVRELEEFTQGLLRTAEDARQQYFWQNLKANPQDNWGLATSRFRTQLWNEVLGRLPIGDRPLNPRTRKFEDNPKWTGYEVMLDVAPDIFAWGYLLLPKDLRHGERRPVVVCQHGLEGLPADTINDDSSSRAYGFYSAFAAKLAERGFVVFSPHNPYRGRDEFRTLQRKLNPLRKTLYSVIIAQHGRILDWLGAQSFVDPNRVGFYGLSYGGKTAMRIPAVFDRYSVAICSGDFNEWIRKNVSVDLRNSYMFTAEYEMFEFNLGNTFNYAEMAALIAPRPFMVERGHLDAVATDEWVAYEFAKVRRLYTELGIPGRTAIEFFDGPHTIHGVGTFDFLHTHLNWPKR